MTAVPQLQSARTPEELVRIASELTDEEVTEAGAILKALTSKYSRRTNSVGNLTELRDEALTRFAEMGIVVEVDPTPCFYGDSPEIEIIGKVKGDSFYRYGFDHERKQWEVLKANERGEAFRGQREPYNKRRNVKS